MERRSFERRPYGRVDVDLCFRCHAIWFDAFESAQLTPGAVVELFRAIHAAGLAAPSAAGAQRLECPVCRERLALTHDLQRNTRITYSRCPAGHGRFSTFYQFLREKSFVRELTPGEIERLRATVAQVRCSSCGAPVDLARDMQCAFCRAPISILDANAVSRALQELSAAEARRTTVDPFAAVDAVLAGQRIERRLAAIEGRRGWAPAAESVDLVGAALGFLLHDL
jgi:hypothetical protein